MSDVEIQSVLSALPSSAYSGSHLSTKVFQQLVLSPHSIEICETLSRKALPVKLLDLINTMSKNLQPFSSQADMFKKALASASSCGENLLLSELLPPEEPESQISRSTKMLLSRELLPDRALNSSTEHYSLVTPRVGLACGFARDAFTLQELSQLSSYLVNSGHDPKQEPGAVSPTISTVYAPFLTFEHAGGQREATLEAAKNQNAINGACCLRGFQMLYAGKHARRHMPALPPVFSCSLNNEVAIIHQHHIDKAQRYCMVPVCRFELRKSDHLTSFLAWIHAIEQWALLEILSQLKASLSSATPMTTTALCPSLPSHTPCTVSEAGSAPQQQTRVVHALKTKFDNIPFRSNNEPESALDTSACSSSMASWGSPIPDRSKPLRYPFGPHMQADHCGVEIESPVAAPCPTAKPAYTQNLELVWNRRFNHGMDEIKDLQSQLQTSRNQSYHSTKAMHDQFSQLRHTIELLTHELAQAAQRIKSMEDNILRRNMEAHASEELHRLIEKDGEEKVEGDLALRHNHEEDQSIAELEAGEVPPEYHSSCCTSYASSPQSPTSPQLPLFPAELPQSEPPQSEPLTLDTSSTTPTQPSKVDAESCSASSTSSCAASPQSLISPQLPIFMIELPLSELPRSESLTLDIPSTTPTQPSKADANADANAGTCSSYRPAVLVVDSSIDTRTGNER